LTELGPENQNRRYAVSSHIVFIAFIRHAVHSSPSFSTRYAVALTAFIRHAAHSLPSFATLWASSHSDLRASPPCVLPMSYPGVYKIYAPYYHHKRSLVARAFLFFVGQVQSPAHTHVGSSPIVGPFFGPNF
jgi:hypothetical protein